MLTKEEYMEIKEALLEELKMATPERAEAIYLVLDEIEALYKVVKNYK